MPDERVPTIWIVGATPAGRSLLGHVLAAWDDALEALAQASVRFTAKGNIVSARRTDELAADLRAAVARAAQDPPQPAVPGCAG